MDNCTRDLYADFMRNLQGCDTVTVSLEGVGETRYTTKEVCEAIDFRVNRRAQPSAKPLTLDELRQMDGEPAWVTCKDGSGARWGIVKNTEFGLCAVVDDDTAYWFTPECGTIAYRRKPERSELDA